MTNSSPEGRQEAAVLDAKQIVAALVAKQTKNEARSWPDWRTMSPDQAIEPLLLGRDKAVNSVILTVADHEQNGFVSLAKWSRLTEIEARAFLDATDASICDDAEPDIKTASFTFILDLMDEDNGDLVDNGKRMLPTQTAMSLAPDEVRRWLEERPEPDSVMDRYTPEARRSALSQNEGDRK